MIENFPKALSETLKWEGGWADHPADPGGATMKGITIGTYREYKRNPHITKEQLRNISDQEVSDIYKRRYWDACRCDEMPSGIDYMLFDFAVNAGVGRATKLLQSCVGVVQDGAIGPKTLFAVRSANREDLIKSYSVLKEQHYRSCRNAKGELLFPIFGKGWMNRLNSAEKFAKTFMA